MSNSTIQIVGDSWAQFIWAYPDIPHNVKELEQDIINHLKEGNAAPFNLPSHQSCFKKALENKGYSPDLADGDKTAVYGTTAKDWATGNLPILEEAIRNNPQLKIIHLSLGGNDFLFRVMPTVDFSPTDLKALVTQTADYVKTVVAKIHEIRPDIQILHVGYTALHLHYPVLVPGDENIKIFNNYLFKPFVEGMAAQTAGLHNYTFLSNLDLLESQEDPAASDFLDRAFHLDCDNYIRLAERCIENYYKKWM